MSISLSLLLLLLLQVGQLHGDMTPLERAAVLDAARKGAFQLLLVSDVAARGLDMPQVGDLVVQMHNFLQLLGHNMVLMLVLS
jgi:superfamily II DNA/RNA helicase